MSFHPQDNPRLGSALFKAPLILSWTAGILVGLSFLVLPGYLFWSLLAVLLLSIILFKNFKHGYYLIVLILCVDMTQLSVSLSAFPTYRLLFFPYVFPLCITLAAWLVSKAWKSERHGKTAPISGLLLFAVTYQLVSLLWAPYFDLGFILAISLALNCCVYYLTRDVITDEATLRKASIAWIWMGIITATGVIASQWFSYKTIMRLSNTVQLTINFAEKHDRPAGFGTVDNVAGLLVSSIFITAGIFMVSRKTLTRLFIVLLISYQLVAVILTASRGAMIGLIAGLILFFIIHPATKNRVLRYVFISIFVLGITVLIVKPAYIDRMLIGFGYTGELYFSEKQATYTGNIDSSKVGISGLDQRQYWWKTAFKEMINRPYKLMLGLGIGGFIVYSGTIGTHSVPLSFFFDMGLMGALIFIFLAVILFKNISRYVRHAKRTDAYYLFIAAVTAFAAEVGVHGLIDYDFYSYTARMFWFPLAYVCAALNVVMSENPDQ